MPESRILLFSVSDYRYNKTGSTGTQSYKNIPIQQLHSQRTLGWRLALLSVFLTLDDKEGKLSIQAILWSFTWSTTFQQSSFIFILIPNKVDVRATFNKERILVCVWITAWIELINKCFLALHYTITKKITKSCTDSHTNKWVMVIVI